MAELSEEEKKAKAEELNNSGLFDVHKWSGYPEVNSAVDALYKKIKTLPEFKGNERLRKKHVKVVILDLYVKWLTDPKRYSSYYRQRNRYTDLDARYNKLHISYLTVAIVDALEKFGYIENHKGHYGRTGGSSHISRMRAKKKLIDLIVKDHKVTPEMIEIVPNTECIILREYDPDKKKQVDIPYEDDEETKKMRKDLYAYNNLLRRTFIDVPHFPIKGVLSRSKERRIKINRNKKFVRRIFNNATWDDGGRFYGGWWQRLPKDWREKITIFGFPTHEIDYSGLHIVILYALEGIDYWRSIGKDPYQIDGYEKSERMRDLLKKVLLISINARTEVKAIKAVNWKINTNSGDYEEENEYEWVKQEKIDIGEMIDSFAKTHAPIKHYFFSNYGVKLQKMDSMMAEHVINEMTKEELPVLCIHDSFTVASPHAIKLHSCMEEAFDMTLSTLTDIDEKAKSRISRIGMGADEFIDLWEKQQKYTEPEIQKDATRKLGLYDGPNVESYDLGYLRRMADFNKTTWQKEYYREDPVKR